MPYIIEPQGSFSSSVFVNSPFISTPSTLLAWSSYYTNAISVIDLETKQNYVSFDGARMNDTNSSWNYLKEILNTKLLVYFQHNRYNSANMEIFDISKKGKANKIYSLGEVSGMNHVTDFDFNPAGDSIATIDNYGVCLISDVNTNNYGFHIEFKKTDPYGRCRWSTNTGKPLLFVKYDWSILNILDVEKKALILSKASDLEKSGETNWIDVCQSNGYLLAGSSSQRHGEDNAIKIFDKRESKIVKTFEGVHSSSIYCVRWNPSGDVIASASHDKTAKLLDFKTEKVLHTGTTPDGNWAMSVSFI